MVHVDDVEVAQIEAVRMAQGTDGVSALPQAVDEDRFGSPQDSTSILRRAAEDASDDADVHAPDPNARARERTGSVSTTHVAAYPSR